MTNFLYVFRGSSQANLSPQEQQQSMQKWVDWMGALGKSGHFKAGEPLESAGTTIRGRKKAVTDGPYAEAKDLVGGYLIVSAKDLAHATELALGCPIFEQDGSVEVRQIRQMP